MGHIILWECYYFMGKFGSLRLNLKNIKAWGILFYGNVNKMSLHANNN